MAWVAPELKTVYATVLGGPSATPHWGLPNSDSWAFPTGPPDGGIWDFGESRFGRPERIAIE